ENNAADHPYIQTAQLNGKEWNSVSFSHETFARGGELRISLGKNPNRDWGR
ncbi:MAG: glycoside hydrolase family 92 protein, partial [Bacteroidetes bacterium]|nr:glycoside hydrolase family 92 protein [Bacteroidota bacterium]